MAIPGSYLTELQGIDGLTELFDIDPDRADLVSYPAIGRKFLLIKARYSNADWGKIKESDYTVEQLARAVPAAIREWARAKAKSENRDLTKRDLRLPYKDPNGTINVGGVRAARQRFKQVKGIPADVMARAKKELDGVWNSIQRNVNKEELDMVELVKSIVGFKAELGDSPYAEKAGVMLDNLADAINKGGIEKDEASGLLDKFKEAFSAYEVTEEQFNTLSEDIGKAIPMEEEVAEEESEEDESGDGNPAEGSDETSEEVNKESEGQDSTESEGEDSEDDSGEDSEDDSSEADNVDSESEEEVEEESVGKNEDPLEQIKKYEKELTELKKAQKEAQEEIQVMKFEKKRTELIKKSDEELQYIGKSAEEMADLFMDLHKAGVPKDVFGKIFDYFKTANEMIDKSGFFGERGTELEAEDENIDPDDKLMEEAKELVKSGEYDTIEKAYAGIIRKDPSRWQELEEE